jgi:glycosyltransferase involved in cell wall biosynthesis
MQALKLARHLLELGVDVKIITWGKFWEPGRGEYNGIPYKRVRSIINLPADIPSLFKKKKSTQPTKIVYDDKRENTTEMNSKVWRGMVLRYRLVFLNYLMYLYFRKSSFDLIHVQMMEWPAFVSARIGRILKKPVLIKDSTMNGIFNLLRYPNGAEKQKEVAGYSFFAAMTKVIRENLLKAGVPAEKISLIPNGIEIPPYKPREREWKGRVVFVGNLTQQPAKGVDILLLAWKTVIKSFPDAHLQIVGQGDVPAYKDYVQQIEINESVTFAGKQTNIDQILSDADIFVLPSRREGMSNALMEAMVRGMPVVVTDISGSQDLVEDGISGIVVPPADINSLANALNRMLADPGKAKEMGKNAYQSIADKCDISKVAKKYFDLYNKILAEQT